MFKNVLKFSVQINSRRLWKIFAYIFARTFSAPRFWANPKQPPLSLIRCGGLDSMIWYGSCWLWYPYFCFFTFSLVQLLLQDSEQFQNLSANPWFDGEVLYAMYATGRVDLRIRFFLHARFTLPFKLTNHWGQFSLVTVARYMTFEREIWCIKILMISYLVELDFETRFGLIHRLSFLCLYQSFLKKFACRPFQVNLHFILIPHM